MRSEEEDEDFSSEDEDDRADGKATSNCVNVRRGRRGFLVIKADVDRKPTASDVELRQHPKRKTRGSGQVRTMMIVSRRRSNCVSIRRGDERSFKADDDRKPTAKRLFTPSSEEEDEILAGKATMIVSPGDATSKKNAKRKTRISGQLRTDADGKRRRAAVKRRRTTSRSEEAMRISGRLKTMMIVSDGSDIELRQPKPR
jgi:hypothetical protein